MAAPRGATPPTKNIAPLVGALAPIAAVAATLYGLPGGVAALIVVVTAAWMSTPPQLTGKGRGGAPAVNPEDPREQSAMLTHRRWASLKWAFAPSSTWLPNDLQSWQRSDAGNSDATPLARVKAAVLWLLVPQAFVTWIAIGVALIALATPVGRLETWFPRDLDGSPLWLAPLNAIAAYAVVRGVDSSRRATAAPEDPRPAVTIEHLTKARDGKLVQTIIPTAVVVLGVAAAVIVVLNVSRLAAIVPFPILAAVGAGIMAGAGMLRAVCLPGAHDEWRQLVAARERWDGVFRQMKLDPAPRLTGHRTLGETEDGTAVVIDTFDVPGEMGGADGFVKLRDKVAAMIATGGMQDVTILNSPALDREGQPIAGSKSATSVRIVTWPAEITADVTDPELDPELAKLRIETFTAGVVIAAGWFQPVLTELDILTAPGSPVVVRTVWSQVESAPMFASALKAGAGAMGSPVAVDMGAGDTVYFGALYDESVEYVAEGAGERLAIVFREAAWHLRWKETLKGKQNPWIQSDVYRQLRLPSGQVIESQPFMQGQGLSLDDYVNAEVEKLLTTTLDNAPFVSITGWGGTGDRDGARHPGAFRVMWSSEAVPSSPGRITPSPTRDPAVAEGIKVVLGAAVNAAFDAAKMPRPEIVRSVALTSRSSDGHIWDLTLRLYGGVTIADIKARIEKIRQGLGGVPWLRVTADANNPDWARLVAGVDPSSAGVTFSRPSNQDICTALNWEQAFADAKVIGTGGTTPTLVRSVPLEKNPKVLELDFRLPPGTSRGMVHEARKKLMPATGNVYLEDLDGPTPEIVRLRACPEPPVPFPAPYNWEAVDRSHAIPFASGVTGEPVEYDWKQSPHLIVLGGTGAGKSALLTNLIAGALIRGCEVYVADPTKVAADFRFAEPWLKAMPLTIPETSAMMDLVYDEVKRRRAVNGQYGVASYNDLPAEVRPPHIVVVIDEFTSLMFADPIGKLADGADEDEVTAYREAEAEALAKRNIGAKSGRFVREARSMGVTLILAGQELKSDTIQKIPGGTSLKGNSSSILLGNPSLGTRQSALKDPYNVPDLGDIVPKGRGLYEALGSKAQIIQSWYDAPNHTGSLTEHIAAVRAPLDPSEKPDLTVLVKKVDDAPVFGRRIDDDSLATIVLDELADDDIIDVGVVEIDLDDELADLFGGEEPAMPDVIVPAAHRAEDPDIVVPALDPAHGDDGDFFDIPLPDVLAHVEGTSVNTFVVAGEGVMATAGETSASALPDGPVITGSRELDAILAWAGRERPAMVVWRTGRADDLHPSGMTNAELLAAALGDEQIDLEVIPVAAVPGGGSATPPATSWTDDVFGPGTSSANPRPGAAPAMPASDDLFG